MPRLVAMTTERRRDGLLVLTTEACSVNSVQGPDGRRKPTVRAAAALPQTHRTVVQTHFVMSP